MFLQVNLIYTYYTVASVSESGAVMQVSEFLVCSEMSHLNHLFDYKCDSTF